MLDHVLLRTFVAVIDEGGFGRAASRLNLTQSAISGHLRRLEAQLGVELMQRTTRSMTLTADGKKLLVYARAILALGRDALVEVGRHKASGRIRLGIAEDFAQSTLLNRLSSFLLLHPLLDIAVTVGIPGTLLGQLQDGALDIVLGSHCESARSGRLMWQEPLVWACGPHIQLPLTGSKAVPLAFFPEPCPYRQVALAELARVGMASKIAMVCSSFESMRCAVRSGFAIAPMTQSQMTADLVIADDALGLPPLPTVRFSLFTADSVQSPLLETLVEWISDIKPVSGSRVDADIIANEKRGC
ncbi:MAG: LysR substrate-binding domain-containing protein [Advenella sp.]|uniref:LysR family transcriptional regulator n=1 Tax=Advenella kashmirensis TaxID=310575 RepID=A0A356LKR5_9BURK|nr:LysR family transcriptional regulator [Advenella kashmirensis]